MGKKLYVGNLSYETTSAALEQMFAAYGAYTQAMKQAGEMVRSALPSLPLEGIDLLIIENVGNLVCPAEFRVGEDRRVMVASVTEGEDKPLKYPLMFRTCDLVLVNKIDLLPHLDYDLDRFLYNLDHVHPDVERILVSARTGDGIGAWREWLSAVAAREEALA